MRSSIAITLCLLVSSSFLLNFGTLVWFSVERSYIIQELCENREVDESQCKGNCVLQKNLSIDNQQKSAEDEAVLVQLESLNFILPDASPAHSEAPNQKTLGPILDQGHTSSIVIEVFHPPRIES